MAHSWSLHEYELTESLHRHSGQKYNAQALEQVHWDLYHEVKVNIGQHQCNSMRNTHVHNISPLKPNAAADWLAIRDFALPSMESGHISNLLGAIAKALLSYKKKEINQVPCEAGQSKTLPNHDDISHTRYFLSQSQS